MNSISPIDHPMKIFTPKKPDYKLRVVVKVRLEDLQRGSSSCAWPRNPKLATARLLKAITRIRGVIKCDIDGDTVKVLAEEFINPAMITNLIGEMAFCSLSHVERVEYGTKIENTLVPYHRIDDGDDDDDSYYDTRDSFSDM